LGRIFHWLDAMPHPSLVCEIAASHVALGAWGSGKLAPDGFAMESLPSGAVVPSPVELNIVNADAVREALGRLTQRAAIHGAPAALLVPDQVVRVFLLHFESFPDDEDDAIPLLRWRLKKSVPFDVEETVVSYMTQASGGDGVEILAGIARQRIIRQFEEIAEAAGLVPGVVLSSTLAVLPLLDSDRPVLLIRMTGTTLTTVILQGELLRVFRCTEMPVGASEIEPRSLLDEVFPAVAYFQDTWQGSVQQAWLAGFGGRFEEFRRALESELNCTVAQLRASHMLPESLSAESRSLLDGSLEALVGWTMNRGA
jgi:type IV pilus assembly protein PilM